ncbi:hypothetical protein ACHAWO_012286 [Cyclotella atomus]|uniref:HAT C-terminal dimerisation domain-containing protein n=1 Tax=Cyclotella atomus TaxID=382360 RepID=A0ABD3PU49_9STRA
MSEWAIRAALNREHAKFRSEAIRQVRVCLTSTNVFVDTWSIAEKVYVERFSQETFDTFMNQYFNSDESEDGAIDDVEVGQPEDLEVVGKLEELRLDEAPDDWEELLSDED